MIRSFDHVTIVVRDVAAARRFFGLLGFREDKAVVISGETFARYMGVDGIEAEHVTLVHESATPRLEVQILRYVHPEPLADTDPARLDRLGFNHVCFAVDDVAAEVRRLVASGVTPRNEIMDFHDRKLGVPRRSGGDHGRARAVAGAGRGRRGAVMIQILVYGDSLTWGIVPNTRRRLPFAERWPGVFEGALRDAGHSVRVIEDCLNGRRTVWDDPFKPGRNGLVGLAQRIEVNSPLALVVAACSAPTTSR